VPDLICLGKASPWFPALGCIGRADLMDAAWPASRGEAIHTSTFLAIPSAARWRWRKSRKSSDSTFANEAQNLENFTFALQSQIANRKLQIQTRGLGLMAGVELRLPDGNLRPMQLCRLSRHIAPRLHSFAEGEHGNVISFTPPLTITKVQLSKASALSRRF